METRKLKDGEFSEIETMVNVVIPKIREARKMRQGSELQFDEWQDEIWIMEPSLY